jgi:hypothetical protein
MIADEFLQSDCTDLLFIDADINFDPKDVFRLMAWGERYGIVAGVPTARKPGKVYITTIEETEDGQVTMDRMGLLRVKRVATAFMLIQRNVFEDLRAAHPEWQYRQDGDQSRILYSFFDFRSVMEGYTGEDFLFCDRAVEHGHQVWVDPTIKLGHMGVMEYMSDFGKDIVYPMLTPIESKKEVA